MNYIDVDQNLQAVISDYDGSGVQFPISVCTTCGALVGIKAEHDQWHAQIGV